MTILVEILVRQGIMRWTELLAHGFGLLIKPVADSGTGRFGGYGMARRLVITIVLAALASGCGATIRSSHGGMVSQTVSIRDSDGQGIEGTKIFVDDKLVGTTNNFGTLKHEIPGPAKNDSFTLKVQKNGYKSVEQKVNAQVDGGFVIGDVFIGLLGLFPIIISLAVDGASDSWMAYPRYMEVVLTKGTETKDKSDSPKRIQDGTKTKANGTRNKTSSLKKK